MKEIVWEGSGITDSQPEGGGTGITKEGSGDKLK